MNPKIAINSNLCMILCGFTITAVLTLPLVSTANPRINFRANKLWETCEVTFSATHAEVDCRVGYRIPLEGVEQWPTTLRVDLPVFLPKADKRDSDLLILDLMPTLQIGKETFQPASIQEMTEIKPPRGTKAIAIMFAITPSETGEFELRSRYRQPFISRVFHYQPFFEDKGPSGRSDNFFLEVITDGSGTLSVVSDHEDGVKIVGGRVRIQFLESERISIKYQLGLDYLNNSKTWIVGSVAFAITLFLIFHLRTRLIDSSQKNKAESGRSRV